MASLRASSVAETGTTFSYAQAAKGRSPSAPSAKPMSSAPSGSATPSSISMASESTPASSWADESDTKASVSSASAQSQQNTPQTRQQPRRVDSSTSSSLQSPTAAAEAQGAASEKQTKPVSVASSEHGSADVSGTDKDAQAQQAPPKPVLQEARQPAVNIWAQRAAEAKAKAKPSAPAARSAPVTAAPSVASRSPESSFPRKADTGPPQSGVRKAENGQARGRPETRTTAPQSTTYPAGTQRRSLPHNATTRSNSDTLPPPMTGDVAWPKPTDVKTDDKRRGSDKDEKADSKDVQDANLAKPHGKTEWKVMPYTPTAVFETPIHGKGSGRMGNGASGTTRTSATGTNSARAHGSVAGKTASGRASINPNEESNVGPKDEPEAQRQKMPPPPVPSTVRAAAGDASTSDTSKQTDDTVARQAALPKRQHSLKKLETTKRNGITEENAARTTSGGVTASSYERGFATAAADGRDSRRVYNARGSEDTGREPKKSGKKSNRNSYAQSSYNSASPYLNGQEFQAGFGGQQSFPPRGSSSFAGPAGRGGGVYRGPARSQSIPMDYGRPPHGGYSAYPVNAGQSFSPEFYSSYPMVQYPVMQGAEREMHLAAVSAQLEYYFSMDNLLKDMFLRKHMDSQGWIFLGFIADFNRLKLLTTDYDLLKTTCLQSAEIEIKVGEDGRDRVRKAQGWEQFVLPMQERDRSAQHAGPQHVRRPSFAQTEAPYYYPQSSSPGTIVNGHPQDRHDFQPVMNGNGAPQFDPRLVPDFQPGAESRGRQPNSSHGHSLSYADSSAFVPSDDQQHKDEPDSFPSSQINDLTVVARKHDVACGHQQNIVNGRSFSDGGIDSRDIVQEIENLAREVESMKGLDSADAAEETNTNGTAVTQNPAPIALLWVKDQQTPIESPKLPRNTVHEFYTHLRVKALEQRDAAATGACPYDLDVLYQFWSHFLIRNFNSSMYNEFRHLAFADATQRHSDVGLKALIKYYSEALCSQTPARVHVISDFVALLKSESPMSVRPGFKQLQSAWSSGRLNIKNRKKLNDQISNELRAELDA